MTLSFLKTFLLLSALGVFGLHGILITFVHSNDDNNMFTCDKKLAACIGADFRFEVPGQSSVGLIGGGRGQWLGGTMASAEHEPITVVQGQSPWSGVRGRSPR